MTEKKVLVVEDDKMLSSIFSQRLTEVGYSVRIAYDGEIALEVTKEFTPDLILLDILLPKKDGFAVIEEVQQDPVIANTLILVLSNLGDQGGIQRAKDAGATDYLIKVEVVPTDVIEKIQSLL